MENVAQIFSYYFQLWNKLKTSIIQRFILKQVEFASREKIIERVMLKQVEFLHGPSYWKTQANIVILRERKYIQKIQMVRCSSLVKVL